MRNSWRDDVHQWGLIHEPFGLKSSDLTNFHIGQKVRCRFSMVPDVAISEVTGFVTERFPLVDLVMNFSWIQAAIFHDECVTIGSWYCGRSFQVVTSITQTLSKSWGVWRKLDPRRWWYRLLLNAPTPIGKWWWCKHTPTHTLTHTNPHIHTLTPIQLLVRTFVGHCLLYRYIRF